MAELSDPDWSTGPWAETCKTRLVRQRLAFDCGVACLAMLAGIEYESACETFSHLGMASKTKPFSSNVAEMSRALGTHGVAVRMKRWRGWEEMVGIGLLKVKPVGDQGQANWHWVVGERHREFGYVVRDPASPLVAFESPPMGVCYQVMSRFAPCGNWLRIG